MNNPLDVAVIGAGAAGLATAIFTARGNPDLSVAVLDGAKTLGAKILISGGGRCNVTNETVSPRDFFGGSSNVVRRTLDAFPAEKAKMFFAELGVPLHVEAYGKLFPDSNSARTVLDALVGETERLGIKILPDHPVTEIVRTKKGLRLTTPNGEFDTLRAVLATGGLSIPKSGSDGSGYQLAASLGHTRVPTTPALAPLLLDGNFHAGLSGMSLPVAITLRAKGRKQVIIRGPMLWTHFGVSGPAPLDASRVWHRWTLEGDQVTVTVNFLPGREFSEIENQLIDVTTRQPRTHLRNVLSEFLPRKLGGALLPAINIDGATQMAQLAREDRRKVVRAFVEWTLPVRDSRGYMFAEVTAGGIPLPEINPATFESRRCPGLHLVGEILDVDGRLGGFNFQWAWSTASVAGSALARMEVPPPKV